MDQADYPVLTLRSLNLSSLLCILYILIDFIGFQNSKVIIREKMCLDSAGYPLLGGDCKKNG